MTDIRIKQTLMKRHLAPSKKLGQNFLTNSQTAQKIVDQAEVTPEDTIVELGVGLGSLTMPLAARVGRLIGLEIDSGIIAYHQEAHDLPENVTLLHQDLLKSNFKSLAAQSGGQLKIMANLPYSISNPLLFKLYENRAVMDWAVLMLQKEVGGRLTAPVGTKEYGILSVLLATCAKVRTLMRVGPGNFHPRPKVDSVVVRISFLPPSMQAENRLGFHADLLEKIVNSAFQQRRKTLLNSLAAGNIRGCGKNRIGEILRQAAIPANTRPEQLTVDDFIRLTKAFNAALATDGGAAT